MANQTEFRRMELKSQRAGSRQPRQPLRPLLVQRLRLIGTREPSCGFPPSVRRASQSVRVVRWFPNLLAIMRNAFLFRRRLSRAMGVALLLVSVSGCYQSAAQRPDKVNPPPGPVVIGEIGAISEACGRDYLNRLADIHADLAKRSRSGEFKSYGDTFETGAKATETARNAAFEPYAVELNKSLPPDSSFDADKQAKVFDDAAAGFRKAAKR